MRLAASAADAIRVILKTLKRLTSVIAPDYWLLRIAHSYLSTYGSLVSRSMACPLPSDIGATAALEPTGIMRSPTGGGKVDR
ncbi:MAG: hypothetical protein ACREXW_13820 [Gammaproteobacteria bacterium]